MNKTMIKKFSTLILGEHNGKILSPNTFKLFKAAKSFNQDAHLILSGS